MRDPFMLTWQVACRVSETAYKRRLMQEVCPRCAADPQRPCVGPSGRPVAPHKARRVAAGVGADPHAAAVAVLGIKQDPTRYGAEVRAWLGSL